MSSQTSTLVLVICLQGVRLSDPHEAPHPFLATNDARPFWLQMMPVHSGYRWFPPLLATDDARPFWLQMIPAPFWLQMMPAPSGYIWCPPLLATDNARPLLPTNDSLPFWLQMMPVHSGYRWYPHLLATDDARPFWLQMMPTPFWLQMMPAPFWLQMMPTPFLLQMMPTPFWLQMIPAPSGYRWCPPLLAIDVPHTDAHSSLTGTYLYCRLREPSKRYEYPLFDVESRPYGDADGHRTAHAQTNEQGGNTQT